ncbi:MAG: hypothetical protein QOG80_1381 [Pseudonocardiales bacterium]|jgi:hypothetical protein|nr:hypothetical protein [Pseudonocardiales bacterium]
MTTTQAGVRRVIGARRARPRAAVLWPIALFVVALVGAIGIYHQLWADPAGRTPAMHGRTSDQLQTMWFLKWVPWQLVHGHNPFRVHAIDYPDGVSLAWNTATPTLGLLAAPVTFFAGPAFTYSLLMTLAPAATSTTAFLWLRRHVGRPLAAAVGGLVIGFGPFASGHLLGHLHVAFATLIPLMLLFFEDLLWRRPRSQRRSALYLGLVTAAQLGISEELVVIIAIAVLVAMLAYLSIDAGALMRAVRQAGRPVGLAIVVALAVAAPLLIEQMVVTGLVPLRNFRWRATVVDYLWTGGNQALTIGHRGHLNVGVSEDGVYLGIVLITVLVAGIAVSRRDRVVRCAALTLAALVLLSVGDIRVFGIPLPWHYLSRVPGLAATLPIRFSFATWFVVAWLIGRWLDRSAAAVRQGPPARRAGAALAVAAIGAAVLTIVPHTISAVPVPHVPRYLATTHDELPPGSLVLLLPTATPQDTSAMYLQQAADFRFVMPGGYAYRANGTLWPRQTPLLRMAELLDDNGAVPLDEARAELARLPYRAIVVVDGLPSTPRLIALATQLTGRPADRAVGGVALWLL